MSSKGRTLLKRIDVRCRSVDGLLFDFPDGRDGHLTPTQTDVYS